MINHLEDINMNLDLENKTIIGVKDLNLDDKNLPILGIILVTDNSGLLKDIKVDGNESTLLSNKEVYQFIKHKEPKSKNALSCFMSRLRNLGLPAIKIGDSFKYKHKDLLAFLDNQKEL
jgi:hypothetical protein